MDMKKPKIVSLFSGAGGLDIGFHKAGFKTVFATDIWDKACETLKINKISEKKLLNFMHKEKENQMTKCQFSSYWQVFSKCLIQG